MPAEDAKVVVSQRAQARWDAMVKSDFTAAYGFLSPGTREVTSLTQFVGKLNPGFWKSAKVASAQCEKPDHCVVTVDVAYTFQGRTITTPVREDWARIGNEWWYLQK